MNSLVTFCTNRCNDPEHTCRIFFVSVLPECKKKLGIITSGLPCVVSVTRMQEKIRHRYFWTALRCQCYQNARKNLASLLLNRLAFMLYCSYFMCCGKYRFSFKIQFGFCSNIPRISLKVSSCFCQNSSDSPLTSLILLSNVSITSEYFSLISSDFFKLCSKRLLEKVLLSYSCIFLKIFQILQISFE